MKESTAESLAKEVLDGTYTPSPLENCEGELPTDRSPQVVRFVQFILFARPRKPGLWFPKWPEYLVFQQYRKFGREPNPEKPVIDRFVKPMARALSQDLLKQPSPGPREALDPERLPNPDDARLDIDRIRTVAVERRIPGYRPNLPDSELRTHYRDWVAQQRRERLLTALEPLERAGFTFHEDLTGDLKDLPGVLEAILKKIFLPDPYQPFRSPHPHFALCATFEQVWEPKGYTRGELINTISLAPGEQLTLEVHSWDKSTIKSEEELATETELRVSENLTQRDVSTVSREVATQWGTQTQASMTVPIKGIPVNFSGGMSGQVNTNLRRTREQVRERTVQASNTLKTTRKLRIEVSREIGREQKQTRVIANTNRCHTLNCHYFEVMSNYLVTTNLVSLTPCLLLRNPSVEVTPAWVLCHEDILKEALLDKVFLPGFDAARVLETHEAFLGLKEGEGGGQTSEDDLGRILKGILDIFDKLRDGVGILKGLSGNPLASAAAAIGDTLAWAGSVALASGPGPLRQTLYMATLATNRGAISALENLRNDLDRVKPRGLGSGLKMDLFLCFQPTGNRAKPV